MPHFGDLHLGHGKKHPGQFSFRQSHRSAPSWINKPFSLYRARAFLIKVNIKLHVQLFHISSRKNTHLSRLLLPLPLPRPLSLPLPGCVLIFFLFSRIELTGSKLSINLSVSDMAIEIAIFKNRFNNLRVNILHKQFESTQSVLSSSVAQCRVQHSLLKFSRR